ncbi:MAG: FdhF/YdeP family oxidoreductase [Nitrospina sp.]|nr:FdhF/YdeP family oxidoreductase [Nitrospina sp.]
MLRKLPQTIAGWHSIRASLKLALRYDFWGMTRSLLSKNACKSCALGMGGQKGGMRDEAGAFPSVCKKSFYAQASDLQGGIPASFFKNHSVQELAEWTPRQLEYAGRLHQPLFCGEGDTHYRAIPWEEAFILASQRLQETDPDRTFFYASGRSSNEAGYLLQLFARAFGTNNVNNCSYYCHQASGVGLTESLGTGTATIELEDLKHTDLIFLVGANPASNHPRFMKTLMDIRRRGGKVVVVNPARERGLEWFHVPSDPSSLLFGSSIASTYLQPHIGGDIALFTGIAKALLEQAEEDPAVLDRNFIEHSTEQFSAFKEFVDASSWDQIEQQSGIDRGEIEKTARDYARAQNVVFAWAMGLTHHAHGVDNIQSLVNLALLRGMVGRPHAGLLPLRGHSNVQGIGSIGVTPQLKPNLREQMEAIYGFQFPETPGWDTLTCMEAAKEGRIDFAWNLGGNLFGANPDSDFTEQAFRQIGFVLYMNTTLNPSHFRGRGRNTLILPVLPRDEEPQPTTQESMFSYVRMSEGGPARLEGPLSEIWIITRIARRVVNELDIDWHALSNTTLVRREIGSVVAGFEKLKDIDLTHEEFQIGGRILHQPHFPTPSGKAGFKIPRTLETGHAAERDNQFQLMTVRSEGQFNTVVYEEHDQFRGIQSRDVVMMHEDDVSRLGLKEGQRVIVKNATGSMRNQKLMTYPIKPGNIMMYYPEANVLVPRQADERSHTPSFKSIPVEIEPEPAG